MRLTCPKCSAEYEVAGERIPPAGRHVQCSACHTRWFADGRPRKPPSEDQIIRRLEAWRPRPVAVPDPVPAPEPAVAAATPLRADEAAGNFIWEGPEPEPEAEAADPAGAAEAATAPPAAPAEAAGPPEPALARPPLRLDLTAGAAHAPEPPRTPGRFARGLGLALAAFAAALALYLGAGAIAARLPAAGPALGAYADWVDGLRERLAGPFGGGDAGG